MSNDSHLTAEVHVDAHDAHQPDGYINPDATLAILTWVTFFLLLAILYKFAWKPILTALDQREKSIADSVDNATKIEEQLQRLEQTKTEVIQKAETAAKLIVDEARKAAAEAAKVLEKKAKEEAQIILENARREIQAEAERAQAQLRTESAKIAVELAEKLIDENLDDKKNQKLVEQFVKNL